MSAIEKVANARALLPAGSHSVLLAGFDGEVYNCLDEKIPAEELKEITFFQGSLARIMAETRAENPNEELGFCDCADYKSQSGFKINICNLPYDDIELNSEHCARRLELYLNNLR